MEIVTVQEELARIEKAINQLGDNLTILEAGCGRRWLLNLSVSYRLIGIDSDAHALKARQENIRDLDSYQVSDLVNARFDPGSFDVIYCSYVLEHVTGVAQVLENFARWTKPGGIIVLRVPDDRTVYGFVAKHSPHWLHILYKRIVYKRKDAGKPGHEPYPVVYEREMSAYGVEQFCKDHGFSFSVSGNGSYLRKGWWITPLVATLSMLSLGKLQWRYSNLAMTIRT